MSIQILPDIVAAQIAAGEVVERPASVVKELIENALDAGATHIRVEAENGGRTLLRITDDGCGIAAAEVELAFARHATSKLRAIEDLDHIQTLGFRGEALASVAAVSQVTVMTRTAHDTAGTALRIDGGRVVERRATGSPVGTALTVENLFFNTPARLKFMKADTTERRHIDTVVTRYAMAYPNVRFTLAQDSRMTFSTSGDGDLAGVLVEALGIEAVRDMVEVSPVDPHRADLPPIRVYGYAGLPQLNRNTRSHIILFVNGRHIQDNGVSYAVTQAYHTLMPADRFPVAVLLIDLPPEDVDVNVHPTKAEVRFRAPDAVFSAVQRAVRRAVIANAPIPTVAPPAPVDDMQAARLTYPPPAPLGYAPSTAQLDLDLAQYDAGRYTQQSEDAARLRVPQVAEPPLPRTARTLPPLRVIGQMAATYIIAEGPAGMYLVDQHAAHERILYEQFMRAHAAQPPATQHTLDSVTLEVSSQSARLIEENLDVLAHVGFVLEPFGVNTFRVRAIPAILAKIPPEQSLNAILGDLELGDQPAASVIEGIIVRRVCKAAAVKAGQILSYDEMQGMIRQLEYCEFPRTCPHGRPTMIHVSTDQLAREFGRA